jgi:glutathione S-transferase
VVRRLRRPIQITRSSARRSPPAAAHRRSPLTAAGRAEPARLILAAVGAEWEDVVPDWGTMKSDAALYPFGQLPVMEDGGVLVSQSNAMIRHLGRKHALAGAGLAQQAAVDVLLDGAEAIKAK